MLNNNRQHSSSIDVRHMRLDLERCCLGNIIVVLGVVAVVIAVVIAIVVVSLVAAAVILHQFVFSWCCSSQRLSPSLSRKKRSVSVTDCERNPSMIGCSVTSIFSVRRKGTGSNNKTTQQPCGLCLLHRQNHHQGTLSSSSSSCFLCGRLCFRDPSNTKDGANPTAT